MSRQERNNVLTIYPEWSYVGYPFSHTKELLTQGVVQAIEMRDPAQVTPEQAPFFDVFIRLHEAAERKLQVQYPSRFPVRMGVSLQEPTRTDAEELLLAARDYNARHGEQIEIHIMSW